MSHDAPPAAMVTDGWRSCRSGLNTSPSSGRDNLWTQCAKYREERHSGPGRPCWGHPPCRLKLNLTPGIRCKPVRPASVFYMGFNGIIVLHGWPMIIHGDNHEERTSGQIIRFHQVTLRLTLGGTIALSFIHSRLPFRLIHCPAGQ